MADKSGGDAIQVNQGVQGNVSAQDINSIATGGAGAVDAMGGMGASMGEAMQTVQQAQSQGNAAVTGAGGSDNVSGNTNVNA